MCDCGQVESAFRLVMRAALTILEDENDTEKARRKIGDAIRNRDARLPAGDAARYRATDSGGPLNLRHLRNLQTATGANPYYC